jgi:hypothetical protein
LTSPAAIAGYLDDGTTASALEHRFRPIKKDGAAMRAGKRTNRFRFILFFVFSILDFSGGFHVLRY